MLYAGSPKPESQVLRFSSDISFRKVNFYMTVFWKLFSGITFIFAFSSLSRNRFSQIRFSRVDLVSRRVRIIYRFVLYHINNHFLKLFCISSFWRPLKKIVHFSGLGTGLAMGYWTVSLDAVVVYKESIYWWCCYRVCALFNNVCLYLFTDVYVL